MAKINLSILISLFTMALLAFSGQNQAAIAAVPAIKSVAAAQIPRKEVSTAKWDRSLTAARDEGKVTLYGEVGPRLRTALIQGFKDAYGLELETVVAPSREISQRLITENERNLNLADAILIGTDFIDIKKRGLVAPADSKMILPEVTDSKVWAGGSLPFLDKDKIALALTGAYWSYILVNTEMVKEGDLKSFNDLINPEWKGKLVMFDPTGGGAAVNWVMFILKKAMSPNQGRVYLEKLAKQDLQVIKDKRLQVEWVARGKYPVAIAPNMQTITEFKKAGAPIAWRRMSEGGLVHPSSSVLLLPKKTPHPNASVIFANWLLSANGQRVFSQAFGQPPSRLGVTTKGIDPFTIPIPGEKFYLIDEDFIVSTQTQGRIIGKEIFGALIK